MYVVVLLTNTVPWSWFDGLSPARAAAVAVRLRVTAVRVRMVFFIVVSDRPWGVWVFFPLCPSQRRPEPTVTRSEVAPGKPPARQADQDHDEPARDAEGRGPGRGVYLVQPPVL